MNAIELLTEQHREAEAFFESIEAAEDVTSKQMLLEKLADALAIHMAIEEEIFYPVVKAHRTGEVLFEAVEEHLSIKKELADLLAMDASAAHFEAKLSVLRDAVERHARDEEENVLFPKVRNLLDDETLEAVGGEMASMAARMEGRNPRYRIAGQTDNAASL